MKGKTGKKTRTDESFRKIEQIFRTVTDNSRDVIWMTDTDLRFTYASPAIEKLTGYTVEEYLSKPRRETIPAPYFDMLLQTLAEEMEIGKQQNEDLFRPKTIEVEEIRKDGTRIWVELRITGIRDTEGNLTGLLGFSRDISGRKKSEEERRLMEKALRESEEKYRRQIEKAPIGFYRINLSQGRFIQVNDVMSHYTGYGSDEFLQMNPLTLLTPESLELFIERQRKKDNNEPVPTTVEYQIRIKNGDLRWAELESRDFMDGDERIADVIIRDITGRKKSEEERRLMEKALRESEEKYRSILDSIEDAYFELDLAGNITFFNNALCKISGYTPDDLKLMNYRLYSTGDTMKRMYRVFHEIYTTGKPGRIIDFEVVRKDGVPIIVQMTASLMRDGAGSPTGFRCLARDVTEHRQAGEALRKSEEKYRLIAENSTDVIWTMSLDGRFTYVSPSVTRHAGYTPEEAMAMTIETYMYEEDLPWVMQTLHEEMQKPREQRAEHKIMELRQYKKDGSVLDVEVSVAWLYDGQGEIMGLQGSTRDITARRKMEEERSRLEAQLIQAQRMEALGTLAGGIAHDFNNLLAGIQGYNAIMQMGLGPDHPFQAKFKRIDEQIRRGANLTRQFLGLARGGKYDVRPLNVNILLTETSDIFRQARKEIELSTMLDKDIRMVEADRGQIEQVFMNLYINAWQAMPGGGELILETRNVILSESDASPHGLRPGNYVRISVTDSGTGMDAQTRERIFEPFFTTKGQGSGLGLASAYGIIKNHDGFITVDSEPGRGARFTIYMPASDKGAEKERQTGEKGVSRGQGTILVVDDEKSIITTTKELLEMLGYNVLAAGSGQEAIAVFMEKKELIDMVILDMIMPGMGGGKTLDELLAIDPHVKVLLSSGYSSDGEAREIMKRGCRGFIQKPFRLSELSHKISEVLELKSAFAG